MNNNIENSKNTQGENIEKKNSNWFREKWESIKNFLEGKKVAEKIQIEKETGEESENLKDSAIDSQLQDLEKKQDIQDSQIDTKKELNNLLTEGMGNKESKVVFSKKELAQELLNNDRFKNRSKDVKEEIVHSANNVSQDIENYNKEQNPIAKSLLGIIYRIMKTEK